MVLAITSDLMAAAPIEHAARQSGRTCRVVAPGALADLSANEPIELVVLDLNAADQVAELVGRIRQHAPPDVPIIAFGPHVHVDKLQAARQAGCTRVLTRGQFHQHAATIIADVTATGTTGEH